MFKLFTFAYWVCLWAAAQIFKQLDLELLPRKMSPQCAVNFLGSPQTCQEQQLSSQGVAVGNHPLTIFLAAGPKLLYFQPEMDSPDKIGVIS